MDSADNISQSIIQSSDSVLPSLSPNSVYSSDYSSDSGFFDNIKNINAVTWILIILILAFLGFNIFAYLAKGTQDVTQFFAPLIKKIFGVTAVVTGDVVDVSSEGAKAVVSETANVINTGLSSLQNVTPNSAAATSSVKGQPITQQQIDVIQQSTLNKALNTAQSQQHGGEQDYEANEASSSVHSAGKSGWCYIGDDRGFRSCAEVGTNDICMSGDIFPSQEICMNPNLRQ